MVGMCVRCVCPCGRCWLLCLPWFQCPDVAASKIIASFARGQHSVVVANPMIEAFVGKATANCVWASNLMRTWQYLPLLDK